MEALNLNSKDWPLIGDEAEMQIEKFFYRLRNMPDITRANLAAESKQQHWLNKWQTLTSEQKKPITDLQFLMIFGIKHEPNGRQITITNRGIEPQINGVKYSYDMPDYVSMMQIIGSKVNVTYDPYDMSRVLISNEENIRFIAKHAVLQPRALQDTYASSRQMLNMILNEKKEQVNAVTNKAAKRKLALANETDPEAIMMEGFMPKELKNDVEAHYISSSGNNNFEVQREAYLDSLTNFEMDWDKV